MLVYMHTCIKTKGRLNKYMRYIHIGVYACMCTYVHVWILNINVLHAGKRKTASA
jgi:hypothetical protein